MGATDEPLTGSFDTAESSQTLSFCPVPSSIVRPPEPAPVSPSQAASSPSTQTGAHAHPSHVKPSNTPEHSVVHEMSTSFGRHALNPNASPSVAHSYSTSPLVEQSSSESQPS